MNRKPVLARWANPKRWVKAALRRFDYALVRPEPSLIDFLRSRNIDLVFDVGANVGQFGRWLRESGFAGGILSFEPVKAAFKELQQAAQGDQKWHVRNLALGAASGMATINVSENSVFSSMLAQTPDAMTFDPAAAIDRTEEIKLTTLDEIFPPFQHRSTFLKIDTQGFERHVLEGGVKSLGLLRGVQLELPIVHLYEGSWSFTEAVDYMHQHGFVISQVRPTNFLTVDPVSLVEVDCIFRRNDGDVARSWSVVAG